MATCLLAVLVEPDSVFKASSAGAPCFETSTNKPHMKGHDKQKIVGTPEPRGYIDETMNP